VLLVLTGSVFAVPQRVVMLNDFGGKPAIDTLTTAYEWSLIDFIRGWVVVKKIPVLRVMLP